MDSTAYEFLWFSDLVPKLQREDKAKCKVAITIQYTVSEKLETAIKILKQTNRQTKQTRGLLTKGVSF